MAFLKKINKHFFKKIIARHQEILEPGFGVMRIHSGEIIVFQVNSYTIDSRIIFGGKSDKINIDGVILNLEEVRYE
ncbi:TPA: hypothetical protein ACIRGU_000650 [Streptococcus suis]